MYETQSLGAIGVVELLDHFVLLGSVYLSVSLPPPSLHSRLVPSLLPDSHFLLPQGHLFHLLPCCCWMLVADACDSGVVFVPPLSVSSTSDNHTPATLLLSSMALLSFLVQSTQLVVVEGLSDLSLSGRTCLLGVTCDEQVARQLSCDCSQVEAILPCRESCFCPPAKKTLSWTCVHILRWRVSMREQAHPRVIA